MKIETIKCIFSGLAYPYIPVLTIVNRRCDMVKPVGPLMIEHRLIERMISVMDNEMKRLEKGGEPDPAFIETAVGFIRNYADRCHHGKEEDILFRDLKSVDMREHDDKVMKELIVEHEWARDTTGKLVKAKEDYVRGVDGAIDRIIKMMGELVTFYPQHIEKEDKDFFPASMQYLDEQEEQEMLEEEYEFDKNFIHVLYKDIVEDAENRFK